jgi:hypothetical protein
VEVEVPRPQRELVARVEPWAEPEPAAQVPKAVPVAGWRAAQVQRTVKERCASAESVRALRLRR